MFEQVAVPPTGAFTSYDGSAELQRLHAEAAARNNDILDISDFSKCKSGTTGLLLAMVQTSPEGSAMFVHRTNAEFSVREGDQVRTEFMLAPVSSKAIKGKLWQVPSQ